MENWQWKKPKTAREIASAEKKKHIFSCALELFKQNGYDNITVKDIANRAGMSEGSIYHFFGSKNGILEGFSEQLSQVAYCHIEPTQQHLNNPCEAIFEYIMAMGKEFEAFGPELTSRYYLKENSVEAEKAQLNIASSTINVSSLLYDLLEFMYKAAELGTLKAEIPIDEISALLVITCNGLVSTWVLSCGSFSLMDISSIVLKRTISTYLKNI